MRAWRIQGEMQLKAFSSDGGEKCAMYKVSLVQIIKSITGGTCSARQVVRSTSMNDHYEERI